MNCKCFDDFIRGDLGETEMRTHADRCPECRRRLEADRKILSLAATLNDASVPDDWSQLESVLDDDRVNLKEATSLRAWVWRVAAMVLISIGGTWYWAVQQDTSVADGRLLSGDALDRVERVEREYVEAIDRLQLLALQDPALVDPAVADPVFVRLYRERLKMIDAHITACRDAVRSNPGNAHVRRYLLTALEDKKDTLTDMLASAATDTEGRKG